MLSHPQQLCIFLLFIEENRILEKEMVREIIAKIHKEFQKASEKKEESKKITKNTIHLYVEV